MFWGQVNDDGSLVFVYKHPVCEETTVKACETLLIKLQFEEAVNVGGGQVVYMDPDNSFSQEKFTQQVAASL